MRYIYRIVIVILWMLLIPCIAITVIIDILCTLLCYIANGKLIWNEHTPTVVILLEFMEFLLESNSETENN